MTNQINLHHPLHGLPLAKPVIIGLCAVLGLSPLFQLAFANIPARDYKSASSTASDDSDLASASMSSSKINSNSRKTNSSKANSQDYKQTPTLPSTTVPVAIASPTPVAPQPAPAYAGWHNTTATMFWVGEAASADNGYIANFSSAWTTDWVGAFGGVDDPTNRCGYNPCGFTPNENPFYAALPYGDYTEFGQKGNLNVIPWFSGSVPDGSSILKNHWIAVSKNGSTAYVQWADVGPFNDDDHGYVFGSASSAYYAGLDLSPAAMDYLGIDDIGTVTWRFVESHEVPAGPWTNITTSSPPNW